MVQKQLKKFVCDVEALKIPGSFKVFPATGGKDGIVINVAGEYHAYVNYCPHKGGPLLPEDCAGAGKEGEKCLLKCQWHGSHFDAATGEILTPPAESPLRKLELIVENGKISYL
ncbi:Rieske (2Fe-2S) protein [Patescibacteria group bacterium]|nr:Rieske (2Fe-2S) protein [Patescibacteria group bacterium]